VQSHPPGPLRGGGHGTVLATEALAHLEPDRAGIARACAAGRDGASVAELDLLGSEFDRATRSAAGSSREEATVPTGKRHHIARRDRDRASLTAHEGAAVDHGPPREGQPPDLDRDVARAALTTGSSFEGIV
jgi:hypothetical protein